jgi:hypothetical protein
MSLAEAVLEIAEELEKESLVHEGEEQAIADVMRKIAKDLRRCVKAAGGTRAPNPNQTAVELSIKEQIEQARLAAKALAQDSRGEKIVVLEGGPLDGDNLIIDSGMPIGAFTSISGNVYRLKDGNTLEHVPK